MSAVWSGILRNVEENVRSKEEEGAVLQDVTWLAVV